MARLNPVVLAVVGGTLGALWPSLALAHGNADAPGWSVLLEWEADPVLLAPLVASGWLYWAGARRVASRHPNSPWPRRQSLAFAGGLATVVIAVASPVGAYDTTLFTVHMVQHLLLIMVAAPLLILGMPVTLALRAATPAVRRGVLLPVLHSLPVKVLAFPVTAWLVFTATMWASHFSPLYDASLDNAWLHRVEHLWYVTAALLFWWPVVGLDPTPWRMAHPVRLLYLFLQMPQNSFLSIAIYGAGHVLYGHYADVQRDWGMSPLEDQQLAGTLMWVVGDLLFIVAMAFVAGQWMRAEERKGRRDDRRRDEERARELSSGA